MKKITLGLLFSVACLFTLPCKGSLYVSVPGECLNIVNHSDIVYIVKNISDLIVNNTELLGTCSLENVTMLFDTDNATSVAEYLIEHIPNVSDLVLSFCVSTVSSAIFLLS